MSKTYLFKMLLFFVGVWFLNCTSFAAETCPDPKKIAFFSHMAPWDVYHGDPQYDTQVKFVDAKILPNVMGDWGAIVCTYENSLGKYAVWQNTRAKKASARDAVDYWFDNRRLGHRCSESIENCPFVLAK